MFGLNLISILPSIDWVRYRFDLSCQLVCGASFGEESHCAIIETGNDSYCKTQSNNGPETQRRIAVVAE